jgi:hypothetical protein
MDKNFVIPHYPFYNEPKLVNEAQHFVQDVRQLLEQIDAEYAIPDELKALRNNADSMSKVAQYVASQQYHIRLPHDITLNEQELKAADYYLKSGDKGKRVSQICNELFSKMVLFAINLDTYARNYKVDEFLAEKYDETIKLLHDCIDELNNKYGNEKELCLCCHSNIADTNGIKHEEDCPLSLARRIIKD